MVWHDAHSVTDIWSELKDISDEPCVVRTIGWLLEDAKKDHVVVAQSHIGETDEYDGIMAIPSGMVVSMKTLVETFKSPSE